jgi:hypothetical protein
MRCRIGDPAGAGLADDELDARVAFEHAGKDHHISTDAECGRTSSRSST